MSGLRGRLLVAFVLAAVPPALVLALAVTTLVARRLDETARARLAARLEAAAQRLDGLRQRDAAQLAAIAREDLPARAAAPEEQPALAATLARQRDLELLEILDGGGRIVSSAHWQAGMGLLDRDTRFPGDESVRLETVAEEYGLGERLALTASLDASWQGRRVVLRAGRFLDADLLRDLSGLMQAEVALRDRQHGAWITVPRSPLSSWAAGPSEEPAGEMRLDGVPWRWAARALNPGVALVVAEPRTESDAVAGEVRRATAGVAAAALVAALAAALWLSSRIARPVAELAEGARRVAEGELEVAVPASGPRETFELARAFNAMTETLAASRARLLQAERVASWREMARRLAHDLKNPLFPIQLSVETLRRKLDRRDAAPAGSPSEFEALFRESSATILEELKSLRRVIDEFSEFARMPQPKLAPTDLNALVAQAAQLYSGREQLAVETELDAGLSCVAADAELLKRALGNLVKNAVEAMPEGGTLRLRTLAGAGTARIDVEDTGPGLTDDQRRRLFTPDYTTKPGGTGLGLAIVQGIVSDHGGRIDVRTEPGRGTCFTIVLPARR